MWPNTLVIKTLKDGDGQRKIYEDIQSTEFPNIMKIINAWTQDIQ